MSLNAASLAPEDAKLITLARSARARNGTATAAAVRDDTGRTYVGTDVGLTSLRLSGLELAVAQAVAGGAAGIEAVAVVAADPSAIAEESLAILREVGDPGLPVRAMIADARGDLARVLPA